MDINYAFDLFAKQNLIVTETTKNQTIIRVRKIKLKDLQLNQDRLIIMKLVELGKVVSIKLAAKEIRKIVSSAISRSEIVNLIG